MGKTKRKTPISPAVRKANNIKKKYRSSPGKVTRCRRAILAVETNEVSVRKACDIYNLSYGYLHRRLSGEVEIDKRKGPPTVFSKDEEQTMAHYLR